MRLSRRPRFIAAFAALMAMAFLQATLAFAACELPAGKSGMAAMQAAAMPDCEEGHDAASFCIAHCQSEDQTLGKAQPSLPDLAQPGSSIRVAQPLPRAEAVTQPVLPFAGPPPRILFQSFLL